MILYRCYFPKKTTPKQHILENNAQFHSLNIMALDWVFWENRAQRPVYCEARKENSRDDRSHCEIKAHSGLSFGSYFSLTSYYDAETLE